MTPSETWLFDTTHIARQVLVFEAVESTNTLAAQSTETEGLALVARQQTAGRGRFGRVWQSRPGSSLLMSIVLQPSPELRRPAVLTAWAAVAIADAVFELTGIQSRIKWPNDLLVRGKKVCGILIEQGVGGPRPRTVVGIGLNLNQAAEEFEAAGLPDATSLTILSGKTFDLRAATETVIRKLDVEYSRLLGGERVAVEADWKWRMGLLGHTVVVDCTDGSQLRGRLREMSFDGLEVEVDSPLPRVISPESVAHIRVADPVNQKVEK